MFAAAVAMLSQATCPEFGCTHDEGGWGASCAWCANRALALDLYEQWRTHDQQANGEALARRAHRIMAGQVPYYQVREFKVFKA
ncbi:hypothetical protein [Oleiagrimonas sp.]|uniref:hypothetical protein n=1 Tax=Oleiagrimonas sp. TaxID=2010330 RepID=UPI002619FC7F|nr:hypothetical protein [Oleiagrimonas sp.]MDA3913281.1 hypothetical protein [Oleiagrimonas sp.]